MSYVMIAGFVAFLVVSVSIVRIFLESRHMAGGDHVPRNVLTRINAEYRDGQ